MHIYLESELGFLIGLACRLFFARLLVSLRQTREFSYNIVFNSFICGRIESKETELAASIPDPATAGTPIPISNKG